MTSGGDNAKNDVLTNSFAASMLLMVLAIASMGSEAGMSNRASILQNAEDVIGLVEEKNSKKSPNYPVFICEFQFHGSNRDKVKLSTEGVNKSAITMRQGIYTPENWYIMRQDSLTITSMWKVNISSSLSGIDSVDVKLTKGLAVIFQQRLAVKSKELISIYEPIETNNHIEIFNQPLQVLKNEKR